MHTLYNYPHSGNSYKVRLLFRQLDVALKVIDVDILAGDTHMPDFIRKTPFEMIPVLESQDGQETYHESNAILWRFGKGTPLGPQSLDEEYKILKWMFYEQNILEPNIGRARRLLHSEKKTPKEAGPELLQRQDVAKSGLDRLNAAIGDREFLLRNRYTIADIALFGYVHVSPQAGIALDNYPNIYRWIESVRSTPNFIEID